MSATVASCRAEGGVPVAEGIPARLRAAAPTPEVAELLDFIAAGTRGILRPRSGAANAEDES